MLSAAWKPKGSVSFKLATLQLANFDFQAMVRLESSVSARRRPKEGDQPITTGLHIPLQTENSLEILTFTFRSRHFSTQKCTFQAADNIYLLAQHESRHMLWDMQYEHMVKMMSW